MLAVLGWSLVTISCLLVLTLQLVVSYRLSRLRTDMSMFNHSLAVCCATSGALRSGPG